MGASFIGLTMELQTNDGQRWLSGINKYASRETNLISSTSQERACFIEEVGLIASKIALIVLTLISSINSSAQSIPKDVSSFVDTRKACDHFRSEPWDPGDEPEVKGRREFLFKMTKKYCTGTDRRLSSLRRKYRNNNSVLTILKDFDESIELANKN